MSKVLRIIDGKLLQTGSCMSVVLPASEWTGEGKYEQIIAIDSVTPNSKIDIQSNADVMRTIIDGNYRLLIGNNNGTVIVYAIGVKPSEDLNLQLTITEVAKENGLDTIWGNAI